MRADGDHDVAGIGVIREPSHGSHPDDPLDIVKGEKLGGVYRQRRLAHS